MSAATGQGDLPAAEAWFMRHGLPWFVADRRQHARDALARRRVLPLVLVLALVAVGVGVVVGLVSTASLGVTAATWIFGLGALGYALAFLALGTMAMWAVKRTFSSLSLLFPLATRALPLLLLFITFLFINTEVWQVASYLDGGSLWLVALLFGAMAVGFLLVRLPEEMDQVDDVVSTEEMTKTLAGTPFEPVARELVAQDDFGADLTTAAQVAGFEKANLVLVLLVAQMVQVLLLALSVFAFFMLFGALAMDREVLEVWLTKEELHPLGVGFLSAELIQVSVFLASFSGLYFTVYAVTDETYREQFFTSVHRELVRSVYARVVYRALLQRETARPQ